MLNVPFVGQPTLFLIRLAEHLPKNLYSDTLKDKSSAIAEMGDSLATIDIGAVYTDAA